MIESKKPHLGTKHGRSLSQENYPRPDTGCLPGGVWPLLRPCFFAHSQELTDKGGRSLVPLPQGGNGSMVCFVFQKTLWGQAEARLLPTSHTCLCPFSASSRWSHPPLEGPPPWNHIYENPCLRLCFQGTYKTVAYRSFILEELECRLASWILSWTLENVGE